MKSQTSGMPANSCVYAIIVTAIVVKRCHQIKGNGTVNVANNMRITNQYKKNKIKKREQNRSSH